MEVVIPVASEAWECNNETIRSSKRSSHHEGGNPNHTYYHHIMEVTVKDLAPNVLAMGRLHDVVL